MVLGQWAPIVGTGLAALGSLYLLVSAGKPIPAGEQCSCPHHHHDGDGYPISQDEPGRDHLPSSRGAESTDGEIYESSSQHPGAMPAMQEAGTGTFGAIPRSVTAPNGSELRQSLSNDLVTTRTYSHSILGHTEGAESGNTGKAVKKAWNKVENYFTTATDDWSNESEFKHGRASDFPEIPGEIHRNPDLRKIREIYNHPRENDDGSSTPGLRRQRSRATSFTSVTSATVQHIEDSSATPRIGSPQSPQSPDFPPSSISTALPRRPQATVSPSQRSSFESPSSAVPAIAPVGRAPTRSSTLEVPSSSTYIGPPRSNTVSAPSHRRTLSIPGGPSAPAIIISSDPDTYFEEDSPVSSPAASISTTELPSQPPACWPSK